MKTSILLAAVAASALMTGAAEAAPVHTSGSDRLVQTGSRI